MKEFCFPRRLLKLPTFFILHANQFLYYSWLHFVSLVFGATKYSVPMREIKLLLNPHHPYVRALCSILTEKVLEDFCRCRVRQKTC
jgi:hypothetical protein